MIQFPALGFEVDGELAVDVDGNRRAGRHENGIEALGLAFEQPLGHLVAATRDGLAEHIGADIAGHTAGDAAEVAHHRGRLGGGCRVGCGLDRLHANPLGQERHGIALAIAADAGDPLGIRDPAERSISPALVAALRVAIVTRDRPDRAVVENEGDRFEAPGDAGECPVANRGAAPDHALHTRHRQAIGGEVVRAGDHLEGHRVAYLPLDRDPAHQRSHGSRPDERCVARHRVSRPNLHGLDPPLRAGHGLARAAARTIEITARGPPRAVEQPGFRLGGIRCVEGLDPDKVRRGARGASDPVQAEADGNVAPAAAGLSPLHRLRQAVDAVR